MPKQPDLIAKEMQGDATVPADLERAANAMYERMKDDPEARAQLRRLADAGERKVLGGAPSADVQAEPERQAGTNADGGENGHAPTSGNGDAPKDTRSDGGGERDTGLRARVAKLVPGR